MKENKTERQPGAVTEKPAKKKKPFYLRGWFIALVILGVIIALLSVKKSEKIVWGDMVLGDLLPEPSERRGEIHNNSQEELWVEVFKISDKEFADYIESCKDVGFTVEGSSTSLSYTAYHENGYKLSLGYNGNDEEMSIRLDAPMEVGAIAWPTGAAAEQIPQPGSLVGKFSYENEDGFAVYIADMTKEDYDAYVAACTEKGFDVDYSKGEDHYYADNGEGWSLSLRYEGNSVIYISIDAPDDAEEETAEVEETQEAEDNNAIDPDFKAAMDSYEDFMDEYVAFMKKYSANPTDLTLIGEYSEFMSEYAKFAEDFAKWENEEMNAAETAYYLEVQSRVSQKLLEVSGVY